MTANRAGGAALRQHLAACEDCTRFRERLEALLRGLAGHHARVSAPSGFAARIRGKLASDGDLLGWAALRLLPATLGLVLLLSLLTWQQSAAAEDEEADPTSAMLSWVLDPAGGENGS